MSDISFQRIGAFSDRVKTLRKQGMSDDDIAELLELPNRNALRILYRADNNRRRAGQSSKVKEMTAKGMGPTAIAREMGIPEGSVRSLLNEESNGGTTMNDDKNLKPWQKWIMRSDEISKEANLPESTIGYYIKKDILSNIHETAQNDPVNHPSHYTDGKIETIDFIEDKKLGFCLGNAVKYISRAGKKNPDKEIEDLEKAVWYIQRRIHELKNSEVIGYKIS